MKLIVVFSFGVAQTSKQTPSAAGLFDEMLLRRVGLAASPDHWHNRSYDMWSLGVLLLELVLGTRDSDRWMKIDVLGMGPNFPGDRRI